MATIFNPWAPSDDEEYVPYAEWMTPELQTAGQPLEIDSPVNPPETSAPADAMAQAMSVIATQSQLIQSLLSQIKNG